jgi:excisionase family DNA binding protein
VPNEPSSITAGGQQSIVLAVPGALLEQIAVRVAELLHDQTKKRGDESSVWLDVDGACTYLCLSRDALYKLTAAQAIPCRKKAGGQGLRFHRDELDAWMETQYPRLDRLA